MPLAHIHLFAGSLSGLVSCVLLQPLDLVKTRMQQSKSSMAGAEAKRMRPSIISTAREVLRTNGVLGLWKGTIPTIIRNVPGSGLYFYTLHYLRTFMGSIRSPWSDKGENLIRPNLVHLSSGVLARLTIGFAMMPVTVIKVRFESNQYNYQNLIMAFSSIVRNEGVRGLFSGFGATAMRDAPFAGIYIVFYERCKILFNGCLSMRSEHGRNHYYSFELLPNMCAGLMGGFGATLCTQPFDLVKSRIQLSPKDYPNTFVAFKNILKEQGKLVK